jgi:oligoendopeptidase F
MQFRKDKAAALNNYMMALQLGGTKTLPDLYKAAGLVFNFSPDYIKQLMQFVKVEMDKLNVHP